MNVNPIRPSVVAIRTTIPDDAFTAGALGTRREGSGVVIRDNGLVLTHRLSHHRGRGGVADPA